MERRTEYQNIWRELASNKAMVFIAGPRQAGKTTFTKIIGSSYPNYLYFNWDIISDRLKLIKDPVFFTKMARKDSSSPLVILDEIHKYQGWKNYLKGIYDQYNKEYSFIISGSGRLDSYQKGGDSLAGRYFLFHLWPFTISELSNKNLSFNNFIKDPLKINITGNKEQSEIWQQLEQLSGFPEPYLSGQKNNYRRWSTTYSNQLIREDIRDLSGIKNISTMETLFAILPSRIGSALSITGLSRDLQVAYNTVEAWLNVFEKFFLTISINTWSKKITRSIKKQNKIYLFDYPRIKNHAARFESMVAIELWRAVTTWNSLGYGNFSLHYIRNKDGQEVDFLIAETHVPFLLVEAKLSENYPSASLQKFQQMLQIPAVQLNYQGETFKTYSNGNLKILSVAAYHWLAHLPF